MDTSYNSFYQFVFAHQLVCGHCLAAWMIKLISICSDSHLIWISLWSRVGYACANLTFNYARVYVYGVPLCAWAYACVHASPTFLGVEKITAMHTDIVICMLNNTTPWRQYWSTHPGPLNSSALDRQATNNFSTTFNQRGWEAVLLQCQSGIFPAAGTKRESREIEMASAKSDIKLPAVLKSTYDVGDELARYGLWVGLAT